MLQNLDFSYAEVRESESKARAQAEMLQNALDEHGLELRVKAANEAEAVLLSLVNCLQWQITISVNQSFNSNLQYHVQG